MAVLPTGFGKSLPFGKSTTNKNNKRQNERMLSTSYTSYSLDARSSEGNVENTRYENSLCRSLIHYYTLLLPIHDLKKRGACHLFLQDYGFNLAFLLLGHLVLIFNKNKEKI